MSVRSSMFSYSHLAENGRVLLTFYSPLMQDCIWHDTLGAVKSVKKKSLNGEISVAIPTKWII